jgi:UDP-2-acetamido-3-amino-2,3-dideoxy-glucuronate N-acetyltransferase
MTIDRQHRRLDHVKVGARTRIMPFVNLYGCEIGPDSLIGPFVEIQEGVRIGARVRVQSHAFLCTGVTVEDDAFIGHGVMFVNDRHPPQADRRKWEACVVGRGAAIGSNATILPVHIGEGALVGAGSVVTHDVGPYSIVAGVPARLLRQRARRSSARRSAGPRARSR